MFTNLCTRRFGRGWVKFTSYIIRSIRLKVKTILLCQTTRQEDVYQRLCLPVAWHRVKFFEIRSLQCLAMIHSQAKQSYSTSLNCYTTTKAGMTKAIHLNNSPKVEQIVNMLLLSEEFKIRSIYIVAVNLTNGPSEGVFCKKQSILHYTERSQEN